MIVLNVRFTPIVCIVLVCPECPFWGSLYQYVLVFMSGMSVLSVFLGPYNLKITLKNLEPHPTIYTWF